MIDSQFLARLEDYLERHCIDQKWVAYLERRGKTFDPHKLDITDVKNAIDQLEGNGLTARSDEYVANLIETVRDGDLFSMRLGAQPLPITDAERAKMLETHRSYFANMLFDFMKRKNLSEADVAKKAHLDIKVFSCLRDDRKYQPTEQTVWSLVFALELNFDEANTLMKRAKVYLSFNVWAEVIIGFFLESRVYDLDLLNEALTHYGLTPIEVHEDFTPPKKFRDEDLAARLDLYIEEKFFDTSWIEAAEKRGVGFSYEVEPLTPPTGKFEKTFDVIVRKLKDAFGIKESSFADYLFKLIRHKNMTEVETYKRANLDRRVFSKIRNEKNYMPAKKTVLAIAFAMQLDFKETNTLLARAGYFLSSARKEDVIAAYFLENQIYDMFLLNEVLDFYGCPLIGD